MALRVVLSRARPLGHQLKGGKFRFLGAVTGGGSSSSIVGHSSSHLNNNNNNNYGPLACWNSFWRRHYYFLPSPPAQRVIYFPTTAGIHPVDDAETNDRVIKSADFAVKKAQDAAATKDDDDGGGGGEIRFVRVVRASANSLGAGLVHYFITLEALRGKADMNVYYAEVLDFPDQNLMKLFNWELVNESFSYPFEELRLSDFFKKKKRRESVAAKNSLVSTWLDVMELRCRDANASKCISCAGSIDRLAETISFGMLNAGIHPLPTKDLIDHHPTVAGHSIVPVFDIKTYEMVYEYALFAVGTQYKNEDEQVHLEGVLWASKSKVNEGWVFRLILEVTNGERELNFYYAIVKACPLKHLELLKWHVIPGSFRHHDEEEVAATMQDRDLNTVDGALLLELSEVIEPLW